jgi:hypothetical protein
MGLPKTTERVPRHTAEEVNREIGAGIARRVSHYSKNPEKIPDRLEALEREWDVERTLEANAATATLVGLTLGAAVDKRFFIVPALVAGFLLQHAMQGWCPPLPVFRRMGFRTQTEIDEERYALKALRGDFNNVRGGQNPAAQIALKAAQA